MFVINEYKAFYICNELDCGFYFSYNPRKRLKRVTHYRPFVKGKVFCPDMNKDNPVEYLGKGIVGFNRACDAGIKDALFPIDFYHFPHRIDSQISRKVNEEKREAWERMIDFAGHCCYA